MCIKLTFQISRQVSSIN